MAEQPTRIRDIDADFFTGRRWSTGELVRLGLRVGRPDKVYGTFLTTLICCCGTALAVLVASTEGALVAVAAVAIAAGVPLAAAPVTTTVMLLGLHRQTQARTTETKQP